MSVSDPATVWARSSEDAKDVENKVRWHLCRGRTVNVFAQKGDVRVRVCRVVPLLGGWQVVPGFRNGLGRSVAVGTAAALVGAEVVHTFSHL